MKFKIGDRVKIASDLEEDKFDVVEGMLKLAGKTAIVTKITGEEGYYLDIDKGRWYWNEEILSRPNGRPRKEVPTEYFVVVDDDMEEIASNTVFLTEESAIEQAKVILENNNEDPIVCKLIQVKKVFNKQVVEKIKGE